MLLGRKIIHLDSVDSTNNYAAMMVSHDKAVHGDVILADEQTAGRGQRGANWQSESGSNLLLSVILKPDNLSVERQFELTQLASLSVVDLLRKIGISAEIKWPNDIYVGNRKICGMLIENSLSGNHIKTAIVGIGLNVNQTKFELQTATSVKLETGLSISIQEVLFSFLGSFNTEYNAFCANGAVGLGKRYREQLMGFGQIRTFEDASGVFEGIIIGVDSKGKLIIQANEEERSYDLKEIRFIFRNAL